MTTKLEKNNLTMIFMMVISLIIQAVSLLKTSVVAGIFGIGSDMDAFNLANSVSLFLFDFVAVGITTIIIPEYSNNRNKKAVDTFITVIYGIVFLIVLLMIMQRTSVVGLLSDRGGAFQYTAAHILVVLLIAKYAQSIGNITVAYFQCAGQYNTPKIITLLCNLMVILALVLTKDLDIIEYTLIFSGGFVLNFAVDFIAARKNGWRYRPTLVLDLEARQLFSKFFPTLISTGVYRLSLIVDTAIASYLDTGKLSALNYSVQIATMIDTVIVGNLMTYIYPKIARRVKENGYKAIFWKDTAVMHLIVCLLSAGFLTVGHEGVTLLFQRGAFDADASTMVFIGAGIYLVGYQPRSIRAMLARYFYASGETKIPGGISVIENLSNIIVSCLLVKMIGFYGIILGTCVSSLIALCLTMAFLRKKFGFGESIKVIGTRYLKSFFTFAVTVSLVYISKLLLPINNSFVSMMLYGFETVVIFASISILINRETVRQLGKL